MEEKSIPLQGVNDLPSNQLFFTCLVPLKFNYLRPPCAIQKTRNAKKILNNTSDRYETWQAINVTS